MIKLFEQFNNEQEIIEICKKYNIENYTINPDGSIDVNGNVSLSEYEIKKIPIKFNKVNGYFSCLECDLTTLENSPKWIKDSFFCIGNSLTSLEGCPISDMHYYFGDDPLESLNGFNGDYNRLSCHNRDNLIKKHKRKQKLKHLYEL